jgi:small subunit ribosomal protein S10
MKFRIFLKSFDKDLISLASEQLRQTLIQTNCELHGVVALPIRIKRFCVLRSPHIDKDSREHFEVRFYKRFIDLTTDSPSVFDFLLKTELPSGVLCSLKMLKEKNFETKK